MTLALTNPIRLTGRLAHPCAVSKFTPRGSAPVVAYEDSSRLHAFSKDDEDAVTQRPLRGEGHAGILSHPGRRSRAYRHITMPTRGDE